MDSLDGVRLLEAFRVHDDEARQVETTHGRRIGFFGGEQRLLHVVGCGQHILLVKGNGHVNGMRTIYIGARQKLNGCLELSSQDEHLEVERRLLARIEIILAILFQYERLQAAVTKTLDVIVEAFLSAENA